MKHYLQSESEVISALETSAEGLSSEEAERRLAENGRNRLAEGKKTGIVNIVRPNDGTGGTLAGRILKSFQTGSARRIIPQRNRRSTEYSPSFIIFSTASRKSPAKKDDRQLPLDSHPVVTVLHSIVQLS